MKNNPLIPYVLIMAFGIGLILFMSFVGAADKNSAEGEGETAELNGEEIAKNSCTSCHGGDLTGSMGPSIVGLEADHIKDYALNGSPNGKMPSVLKSEAEAQAVAEYISGL